MRALRDYRMSAAMPKIPRNVGPLGNSEAVKSVPNFRVSFWGSLQSGVEIPRIVAHFRRNVKRPAVAAIGTAQRK
jgi:hypothetical protein